MGGGDNNSLKELALYPYMLTLGIFLKKNWLFYSEIKSKSYKRKAL